MEERIEFTNIVFPSDFSLIQDLDFRDLLLISDDSLKDTEESNKIVSLEALFAFFNKNSLSFRGIASPSTKPKASLDYLRAFYLVVVSGDYNNFLDREDKPLSNLSGDVALFYSLKDNENSRTYWEKYVICSTNDFVSKADYENDKELYDKDNYLQKNAMQDAFTGECMFEGEVQPLESERFFRMYDNSKQENQRLPFAIMKSSLQAYITKLLANYPTFASMYQALGLTHSTSSEGLSLIVASLQKEVQQKTIPFTAEDQVIELEHGFEHLPNVKVLNAKRELCTARVTYPDEKTLTIDVTLIGGGTIYIN